MSKSIVMAVLLGIVAAAPAPVRDGLIYATRADIAAVQVKAAAAVQPGRGTASQPLMALGGYTAKVEYHVGPNFANAHPDQAELFQAIDGSGTLTTGGMINGKGPGSSITGGASRRVAAGDVFIVPEGMPHWFNQVDGHLVLISVMLPRRAAVAAR